MFVDGFHVAEQVEAIPLWPITMLDPNCAQMARQHPSHYQLLCTIPLEFIEEGFDVHRLLDGTEERFDYDMVARHKTFKWDFYI